MEQLSVPRRVTTTLADATGRSDEELRLAMTVAALAAGLIAALRVLKYLADLGSDVFGRSRK